MLKKALILLSFLLLAASLQVTVKQEVVRQDFELTPDDGIAQTENPLGDGEENNSGSDRDASEDDDVSGFDHNHVSFLLSSSSVVHFVFQQNLFHSLSREVIIPPPKA